MERVVLKFYYRAIERSAFQGLIISIISCRINVRQNLFFLMYDKRFIIRQLHYQFLFFLTQPRFSPRRLIRHSLKILESIYNLL